MPNINKPNMSRAWANAGEKTKPDDAKIDLGWISEKPPYQSENWEQNRADVYLQHLNERGTPEWDGQTIYSTDSLAYSGGKTWISLQNSNLNHSPTLGGGWWIPLSELSSPPAQMSIFAGVGGAPAGWLLCDGSAVSRVTYDRLYSFIGDTYGAGDGSTTFNLPDMVDRTAIGAGSIAALGIKIGAQTHKLTVAETPSHSHSRGSMNITGELSANSVNGVTVDGSGLSGCFQNGANTAGGGQLGGGGWNKVNMNAAAGWSGFTSTSGSGAVHNNMQPSMGLNWIIKT